MPADVENWLMKLKCPNLLKPVETIIHDLSEPFLQYETPCITLVVLREALDE